MRRHSGFLTTFLLALAGLTAAAGEAHAANAALEQARAAYDELDYLRVLPLVDEALRQELTPAEQRAAHELRAFVYAIEGRNDLATRAFREVLKLDAGYDLPPSASPKLRAPLDAARAEAAQAAAEAAATPAPIEVPPETAVSEPPLEPTRAVVRDSGPSLLARPLFWVGVATAVAATTIIVLVARHDGTPDHDFGPFVVQAAGRPVLAW